MARHIIEDPNAADGFPDDGKGADFTLRTWFAAPLVANPADDVVAVQDEPFKLTLLSLYSATLTVRALN